MRSSVRGFTLIELMVVMAIAVILLGIGVPSFKTLSVGHRVRTVAGEIMNAAVLARSEAIKRNEDVTIAAATGGWVNGWTVSAGGKELGRQMPLQGITIASADNNAFTQIVYVGSGRLSAPVPGLVVKGEGGCPDRVVTFDLSGMPKIRKGTCS